MKQMEVIQKPISLQWKMRDRNYFEAQYGEYTIIVKPNNGPYWAIFNNGVEVDLFLYHSPTKDELTAKVQAERCFNKLITTKPLST